MGFASLTVNARPPSFLPNHKKDIRVVHACNVPNVRQACDRRVSSSFHPRVAGGVVLRPAVELWLKDDNQVAEIHMFGGSCPDRSPIDL
jgi:hypothetical protein